MKQHITVEQLDELSDKAFRRLNKWVFKGVFSDANDLKIKGKKGRYYAVTTEDGYFLSIGQMIEFLGENVYQILYEHPTKEEKKLMKGIFGREWEWTVITYSRTHLKKELCDALWEACKEILEK